MAVRRGRSRLRFVVRSATWRYLGDPRAASLRIMSSANNIHKSGVKQIELRLAGVQLDEVTKARTPLSEEPARQC